MLPYGAHILAGKQILFRILLILVVLHLGIFFGILVERK